MVGLLYRYLLLNTILYDYQYRRLRRFCFPRVKDDEPVLKESTEVDAAQFITQRTYTTNVAYDAISNKTFFGYFITLLYLRKLNVRVFVYKYTMVLPI